MDLLQSKYLHMSIGETCWDLECSQTYILPWTIYVLFGIQALVTLIQAVSIYFLRLTLCNCFSFLSASCQWLSAISAVSEFECRKTKYTIRGV